MAVYGLTDAGLVIPSVEVLKAELDDAVYQAFGIKAASTRVFGIYNAIIAEGWATIWELIQLVNGSMDPDAATGASLAALCALTGTIPRAAVKSTVTLTLTGEPLTLVPAGSRASVVITEAIFETLADALIEELSAWEISTAYAIGDRVTNADRAYECTTAGTSAGSGGPTTTAAAITDGSAVWRYMGEGDGAIDVASSAVTTGPTIATSGDLTVIETAVSGWSSVINLLDADVGSDAESDEALRLRRELELAASGRSTAKAIRAAVLELDDVTSVTVFENKTDVTDGDGVPPHSVEVLVRGGDDQEIWDCLLENVAAGIQTVGTEDGTAEDDEGVMQAVSFSRPEEILIYVDVEVTKDPLLYPADGDAQVKAAIVAAGDARPSGYNVRASSITAIVHGVPGVLEVTDVDIGTSPSPSGSSSIAVSLRQLAVFDTSRITVTSADGTP